MSDELGFFRVFFTATQDLHSRNGEVRHPWRFPPDLGDGEAGVFHDAIATIEVGDIVAHQSSALLRLTPLRPELWQQLRPGDELVLHVGADPRGTALLLEPVGKMDADGYLTDRHVSVGPLELETLKAGLAHGVLAPDALPEVATTWMTRNVPGNALVHLAGLDVGHIPDPNDARDLIGEVFDELGHGAPPTQSAELAANLLAELVLSQVITPRECAARFYLLAISVDYEHSYPEAMKLFGVDDEWLGGWGRTVDQLEGATISLAKALVARAAPELGLLENRTVMLLARLLPK